MVTGLRAVVWERDPRTHRVRWVNDRIEELLGWPRQAWLDEPDLWARSLHPEDRARLLQAVDDAVVEGTQLVETYRIRARDGRLLWVHHLGHLARDETGQAVAMHDVLIDVTAQRRREEAADLLAGASAALAAPGTVEERLAEVAGLAVGRLCQRASVWLRRDDGRYQPVAAAPADQAADVLALAPVQPVPGQAAALSAGRPFYVPVVTDEMRRAAADDDEHYAAISRLRTGSVLAVPLVAGGEVTGMLALAAAEGEPAHDEAAHELAAELGSRIASMVAAEAVALRQQGLYDITVALSAAGSVAEAARELADGVHRLLGAEVVSVCRVVGSNLLQLAATIGYPTDRLDRFATMPFSADLPLTQAARTAEPVWLPDRDAWAREFPRVMPSLLDGTQAAAALPLLSGGRVVGALGVSFSGARAFGSDERSFLLAVAGQTAVAFERASLADARREIADTLQHSLLPRSLPTLDRLAVSARYLPGVIGTQAGGDWYEVLPLDDGRLALVVGDVVGEGAPAAAVMGQLRSAVAALLLEGHGPARALELLDRFAQRVEGAGVTTVACLLLDRGTGRLTYSLAGHLPPLVTDGEGPRLLDASVGPALGLAGTSGEPVTPRTDVETVLPSGATLVLYTDGLVERRGLTVDEGVQQLADAADRHRTASAGELVEAVLSALVPPSGPADDIAVVAARLLPAPLRLELPAEPRRLVELRRAVQAWAGEAALDARTLDDLQLAMGEAVANAVEHAYRDAPVRGDVRVELAVDVDGELAVRVEDDGLWLAPPGDRGFRGRGLEIVRSLSTGFQLDPGAAGTVLRFALRRPGPEERAAAWRHRPAAPRPAELVVTTTDEGRCLQLDGDLDLGGVAAVGAATLAAMDAGEGPVELDLGGLGHLASAGMGLLLEVVHRARRTGTRLRVRPPRGGPARRVLEVTGLEPLLSSG
jgi:anti-anti-sigma factor